MGVDTGFHGRRSAKVEKTTTDEKRTDDCLSLVRMCAAAALCAVMGGGAAAAGPFALVTGRRDSAVAVIDLGKALLPVHHATANAVISRVRVTTDVDTNGDGVPDTSAAGLPSNIVILPKGRHAYVVNHSGNATPAQMSGFQHGWADRPEDGEWPSRRLVVQPLPLGLAAIGAGRELAVPATWRRPRRSAMQHSNRVRACAVD